MATVQTVGRTTVERSMIRDADDKRPRRWETATAKVETTTMETTTGKTMTVETTMVETTTVETTTVRDHDDKR